MQEIKKTIAIQVSDPVFLENYEKHIKDSGLKVRDYLIGLITADMDGVKKAPETQNNNMPALIDDPELMAQIQEQLNQSGESLSEYLTSLIKADINNIEQTSELETQDAAESSAQETENNQPEETTEIVPHQESDTQSDAVQTGQTSDATPTQDANPGSPQSIDFTNLFVKITKDQREALEIKKTETGENVGALLNRLIDSFLENVRNGDFSEGFEETYEYYTSVAGTCNTTCSAKIPSQTNQELFSYLEQTGKSRNVLISCLVHMDLYSQDMAEEQAQGMSM